MSDVIPQRILFTFPKSTTSSNKIKMIRQHNQNNNREHALYWINRSMIYDHSKVVDRFITRRPYVQKKRKQYTKLYTLYMKTFILLFFPVPTLVTYPHIVSHISSYCCNQEAISYSVNSKLPVGFVIRNCLDMQTK